MSKQELVESEAVGITWANIVLGNTFSWIIPVSVALSTFSSATATIFSCARYIYSNTLFNC